MMHWLWYGGILDGNDDNVTVQTIYKQKGAQHSNDVYNQFSILWVFYHRFEFFFTELLMCKLLKNIVMQYIGNYTNAQLISV